MNAVGHIAQLIRRRQVIGVAARQGCCKNFIHVCTADGIPFAVPRQSGDPQTQGGCRQVRVVNLCATGPCQGGRRPGDARTVLAHRAQGKTGAPQHRRVIDSSHRDIAHRRRGDNATGIRQRAVKGLALRAGCIARVDILHRAGQVLQLRQTQRTGEGERQWLPFARRRRVDRAHGGAAEFQVQTIAPKTAAADAGQTELVGGFCIGIETQ